MFNNEELAWIRHSLTIDKQEWEKVKKQKILQGFAKDIDRNIELSNSVIEKIQKYLESLPS